MPPAVGYAEAICPIDAATMIANSEASGQPKPMDAPPVALRLSGSAVTPPARMQMMENEMAKFWKPPMRRDSSWA